MYSVNLTRKFRRAALIALPLALMACGTDSITGVEAGDDAALARASSGSGKVNWIPSGTYLDYATQIFHYKGSGLASYQDFSVSVTARVTASYDCGTVANAFTGVSEAISGSHIGQADKKGQTSGSFQLAPSGSLRCEGGLEPTNFSVHAVQTWSIAYNPR